LNKKQEPSSSACHRQTWRALMMVGEPCPSWEPENIIKSETWTLDFTNKNKIDEISRETCHEFQSQTAGALRLGMAAK